MGVEVNAAGLRVGLVANGWPPDVGGVPRQVEMLARGLLARGARPTVLALSQAPERQPGTSWAEELWPFPVRRFRADYGREANLMDGVQHPAAEQELVRWAAAEKLDLVHLHHLTGFGLGCLSALGQRGLRTVLTLHDYWCFCPRGQMWHVSGRACAAVDERECGACLARTWPGIMPSAGKTAESAAEGRAAGAALDGRAVAERLSFVGEQLAYPSELVTPSHRAAQVLAACGLDRGRIVVLPGGSELPSSLAAEGDKSEQANPVGGPAGGPAGTSTGTRASAPAGVPAGIAGRRGAAGLRVGVLGATQTSKGALFLARVVAAAPELTVELHIHGPAVADHGDTSGLQELAQLAARDRRIHLHGAFAPEDLAEILAGLDALAAPALWEETFGLTVREARAAGLPVLVSDRGALAEGLTVGPYLTVLPAGEGRAWAAALAELRVLPREPDPLVPSAADFVQAHLEIYAG